MRERDRRKQKVKKTPLFDRIFKPKQITLENGHTVISLYLVHHLS